MVALVPTPLVVLLTPGSSRPPGSPTQMGEIESA